MSHFPALFAVKLAKSCGLLRDEFCSIAYVNLESGKPAVRCVTIQVRDEYHNSLSFEHGIHGMETDVVWDEIHEQLDRLEMFQKFSMLVELEKCLMVFVDIDLDEDQEKVLGLVHELTKPWAKGEVADFLMTRLKDGHRTNKEIAGIAQTLLNALNSEGGDGLDSGDGTGVVKAFYMELTGDTDKGIVQ